MDSKQIHELRIKKVELSQAYQAKKDINPNYLDRVKAAQIASISRKLNDLARLEELEVIENRAKAVKLLESLKNDFKDNTNMYIKVNTIYKLLTKNRGY